MAADKAGEQGTEKNEASANCSGISDQEKELSRCSFQAFMAGNYEACLQHLGELKEINKDDYKIMLNMAVTEFYKNNQTTTDNFKQTLNQLRNEVHSAVDEMDSLDDVENSMLYYNQAVILYYLRQHMEAIAIGEKLYQFIEPFEEKFAHAVCFLLVDIYLLTYQTEKALHLLVVLEKMILQGSNNNKNGKNNETNNNSNNKEALNTKTEGGVQLEAAKSKIHQHKVRAYIQMKSLKACKREIKSVMNTSGNSAPSLFLKSNFEYLRGNYRKAVKLLNSSNISEHPGFMKTGECVRCMFWNNLGCIHFAMGKHNLGLFYFKKAIQENDNACAQLTSTTDQGKKFSGRPMCTLLTNKRYELLYNCGIQLLHIGRPLAAFECLIEAVQVYHSNPRLWLRLAECCIAANKGTPEQETKGLPSKKGIVQSVVGQGYHRKIVLASQSVQNLLYNDGESSAIPVASMEFAAICLRNALLLLPEDQQDGSKENGAKNSSQIGNQDSSGESSEACSNKNHESDKFLPAPPSSPLKRQELENLRCSVLACSSYVALALGDNLMSLNHAEKLLQQPRLSGSLKFLGHLYAAEALISLDRISDAITHLNPENVTDVSLGISSNEQEQASDKGENEPMESVGKQMPQCYPSSVTSARTMMLFNLGSAYCLRSEYDKARKCLHQAASMIHPKEIPPEAILLAVYLELQNGNTQLALQIIKRNQLLPSVKMMSELRKKPLFQPIHQPMQPIQMPAFTTIQRK
ncbi:CCR4-NOT transcription complex subunit 10 isoform X1 [Hyla sarda]|uniref:CCR4-NOT transcription complex subunit 10 isoform X1 n=1 Tax=Hyla sarda TaxID=327740 RepID=UPI0024C22FDA|nr:CCR4-NOT transcription complex subunit 10 isoform X1 [Hyla sarda]XP_056376085.1 CCR4-NOT transcription complex subunit 10 isoform X1 [Hyla sarda]XP_056376086.1 CCR4-NOT transcription complex subunit 10 isoform X1 [Hyla sarda]XP_056376087.1 CCR4-NOT transcription complex subunit 10 isoform X1 [Hyla sarda]